MKKTILLSLLAISGLLAFSQKKEKAISIIPEPVRISRGVGYYKLSDPISVSIPNLPELKLTTAGILEKLSASGKKVSVRANSSTAAFRFVLNKTTDKEIGDEGYRLSVKSTGILVTANKPAGLFYAAQTIWQLLPQEIENNTRAKTVSWQIPLVEITDYPRFAWRGLMFDVSRHFFTKKDVEDFIDQMVQYKFNLLHMHLTDDEGWRIEIKSLPRLTSVGAWNVKREGYFGTFAPVPKDEPRHFGGFYTQDDIRALVKYAQDRFVNILPEVDVPGHSMAAIVSYPDLSCTPGSDKYQVISGERFMDWPGPVARQDNTLCPANERVYTFLDSVFTEIAGLFPFPYIHVGGDECAKNFWEQSDAIKQLMAKENLKTMEEVQSYFEKRVEKIVESKGKKLIGWDEILEGRARTQCGCYELEGYKGRYCSSSVGTPGSDESYHIRISGLYAGRCDKRATGICHFAIK
jgi:hexosaminidase